MAVEQRGAIVEPTTTILLGIQSRNTMLRSESEESRIHQSSIKRVVFTVAGKTIGTINVCP